ncbi:MAG: hypothetical protein BRD48_05940 [Bacteroidetes bacterium QS_9_68_14]|nr:MAG: hypothetical protein BRD48_05940 [Bacteroidetes bacterium QS_9_68_14]
MKTLATFLLALAVHLTLGWAWTLAAGIAGGAWARQRGWLVGLVGVAAAWAALVAYNFAAAPNATTRMARTVGALLGNLPGWATVLATVLMGALLGTTGGFIGQQSGALWEAWTADDRRQTAAS